MMNKAISIIIAALIAVVTMTGCRQSSIPTDNDGRLSVVTTIFAPYDFVRQIVGDKADITMLLPPASESHSYEPTPQDIIKIQNCDVFIYVGGDSDSWVDVILSSMDTDKMRIVTLMDCVEAATEEIVEGMEDDHGHNHGEIDPDNVKDRPMSDFNGSWVSGIPLINDGFLDKYIEHTAEESGVTSDEQRMALLTKWASEYDSITISDNGLSYEGIEAEYEYKGFTVVESDNDVSVWYQYQMLGVAPELPTYLAFNDHGDGNTEESHDDEHGIPHMHMRYGNNGFEDLLSAEDAPYYFDNSFSADQIGEFMLEHSHEEEEGEEEYDEHVWTSPGNAKLIVQKISDAICQADAANATIYQENTASYIAKLTELDAAFQDVVDSAVRKTIVFGDRFPFRYLADAYGLEYFAAFPGCSTSTEASVRTVAFLIDKINAENIPVVFHIELSNMRMANTISESTGAKVMLLHACHNITRDDFTNGVTYLDLMLQNVDALREALH